MIIECPACSKKFNIDEKLIPDEGRLLKCGNCDHTWFFKKEENIKSKPLIIFGFVLSLTSIFLLLFTINNKFG